MWRPRTVLRLRKAQRSLSTALPATMRAVRVFEPGPVETALNLSDQVGVPELKAGEVLIFNQNLPHGNRVNQESETRWSMNCRFKSVFTPYGDKKIGEFFEPVTLKAASRVGMNYRFPQLPSKSD